MEPCWYVHVEPMIICPDSDIKVDYYSRKQKYTVNTQAVVGADLVFQDVATGFADSVHDFFHFFSQVLRSTSLFAQAEREIYLAHLKNWLTGFLSDL